MNYKKDYYDILGVRQNAKTEEIDLAYKGRRSQYHPDKYANSDLTTRQWATEKMQEINEAYNVLSNEETRHAYDLNRPIGNGESPYDTRQTRERSFGAAPSYRADDFNKQKNGNPQSRPENFAAQANRRHKRNKGAYWLIFWLLIASVGYRLYGQHEGSDGSIASVISNTAKPKVICNDGTTPGSSDLIPQGACAVLMPDGEIGEMDSNQHFICRFRCIDHAPPNTTPLSETSNNQSPSASAVTAQSVTPVASVAPSQQDQLNPNITATDKVFRRDMLLQAAMTDPDNPSMSIPEYKEAFSCALGGLKDGAIQTKDGIDGLAAVCIGNSRSPDNRERAAFKQALVVWNSTQPSQPIPISPQNNAFTSDSPPENRCGWIKNNIPSGLTLRDRDGTWSIVGGSVAGASIGINQMPATDKGESCGCLTVETNKSAMQIVRILGGSLKPLSTCQNDRHLNSQ